MQEIARVNTATAVEGTQKSKTAEILEHLCTHHRQNILTYLTRLTENTAEAEDALHSAMLRLLEKDLLQNLRNAEAAKTFVIRAALNVLTDRFRRAATLQRIAPKLWLPRDEKSPLDIAGLREEADYFRSLLSKEENELLRAAELRAKGFTYSEVVDRLGLRCTPRTLCGRLLRFREKFENTKALAFPA